MKTTRVLLLLAALAAETLSGCLSPNDSASFTPTANSRSVESLNSGWRFAKGDPADTDDQLSYEHLKPWMVATSADFKTGDSPALPAGQPGADVAYVQPDFDDSAWRTLDLPHDWGIEGPFDQKYPGETAKLPYWGVGWYRKQFDVPAADESRQIFLDVDGAMSRANVWINDHYAGGWAYGYNSWRVDLTPYIHFGGRNVLAIRLDNPADSSRWYPGGGIYRNVWLVKTAPIHVAQWGTRITTPEVSSDQATIDIAVTVDNDSSSDATAVVTATIHELGPDGRELADVVATTAPVTLHIAEGSSATGQLSAQIPKPNLWSPDSPRLYRAAITVEQDNQIVDGYETTFGVRTFEFTAEEGFVLNGRPLEIQGVCLHHDLGALGAALNVRARERHLEMLKAMGCNAIRPSHNPPAPELLDLCDRMGFLVMCEAFDAWQMEKRPNDYHVLFDDWHEQDLRAMIRRDRNHPSVVLWSLGNEIYEQREGKNWPLAKQLADIAHDEDPTRPVNMALHVVDASTNGFQNAVDVFGYNYTPFGYAQFRKDNPTIPLIGSETSSCCSTRGEYFFPVDMDDKRTGRVNFQVTSYDYSAPKWAMAPDIEFKGQDENPFVAGEFVWTGVDYLGEPTPLDKDADEMLEFTDDALRATAEEELASLKKIRVPSRSSYFGMIDLAGFPKDRFYIYQARWRPELPMAHILPHWNWPEREGQVTPVHVYTSGDEAELFLNGVSLGRKKKGPFEYRLKWDDVVYEPGELKVVAYRDGQEWATDVMKTAGPAARLTLNVDRNAIDADGRDLAFVTATIVDEGGLMVPRSHNPIRFTIDGPGQIVATDNGDPTSHEPFQLSERDAFNGLCLAIVRAEPGQEGTIALRAESEGLEGAEVQISAGIE